MFEETQFSQSVGLQVGLRNTDEILIQHGENMIQVAEYDNCYKLCNKCNFTVLTGSAVVHCGLLV